MTTGELGLAHISGNNLSKRQRRSIVTLGLTLFGFLVGESFGQQIDTTCTSCRVEHVPGAGTTVRALDPSRSFLEPNLGTTLPSRDPWLVVGGWSGAYSAPLF